MTDTSHDPGPGSPKLDSPSLDNDVLLAPIARVRDLLDRQEVSPVELVEAALDRIARRNPELNAFSSVAGEEALAQAHASAHRIAHNQQLGPLDGIVVAVKDNVAVAGMPMECGSAVLRGNVATEDASCVVALRQAGAVIIGKTTLDEFTLTTVGPARNPLDTSLTPGGSSGGSGVAVQAGMCFAAIGTDTGGSVRIPAECCAVTGLKPTQGLLRTDGVLPLAASLDHLGVLARTTEDTACFLEALLPGRPSGIGLGIGLGDHPNTRRHRIGIPNDLSLVDEPVRARFLAAVERAAQQGTEVTEVTLPDLDQIKSAHWTILSSEIATYHLRRFGRDEDRYLEPMRDTIAGGATVTTAEYLAAQESRGLMRRTVDELLADLDALALPTLAITVPAHDAERVQIGGSYDDVTAAMVRLTSLFNHSGHPAISVPPATAPRDQPSGIQLVAPHYHERPLLGLASAFEG